MYHQSNCCRHTVHFYHSRWPCLNHNMMCTFSSHTLCSPLDNWNTCPHHSHSMQQIYPSYTLDNMFSHNTSSLSSLHHNMSNILPLDNFLHHKTVLHAHAHIRCRKSSSWLIVDECLTMSHQAMWCKYLHGKYRFSLVMMTQVDKLCKKKDIHNG